RFGASQKPDGGADQRERHNAENYDCHAVLFPEGGRYLTLRRTKRRDFVAGRGVGDGAESARREQAEGGGQNPKQIRRNKPERLGAAKTQRKERGVDAASGWNSHRH